MAPRVNRTFLPPGDIDDFTDRLRRKWHETMNATFEAAITAIEVGNADIPPPGVGKGRSQFYNPSRVHDKDEISLPIVWSGFPRALTTLYDEETALDLADHLVRWGDYDPLKSSDELSPNEGLLTNLHGSRLPYYYRPQDEYLEWHVQRDQTTGQIDRIAFTSEARDYWEFLAQYDLPKVLQLYRRFINPAVQAAELLFPEDVRTQDGQFKAGAYNPWNIWNTQYGAMHLTHRANTLGAEVVLAAAGTALRHGFGTQYLSESARLICCSNYGGANRSSDPQIGSNVNKITQLGGKVSLEIPVGLYIDSYDEHCVTDETGLPIAGCWKIERGQKGAPGYRPSRILRLVFEIPQSARRRPFNVFVDGRPLTRGGQLAKHIHMKLIATTFGRGRANDPLPCISHAWRLKTNRDYLYSSLRSPGTSFERAFPDDPPRRIPRRTKRVAPSHMLTRHGA
jgi:hypothetical protein